MIKQMFSAVITLGKVQLKMLKAIIWRLELVWYALRGRPVMHKVSFHWEMSNRKRNLVFNMKGGLVLTCSFPSDTTFEGDWKGSLPIKHSSENGGKGKVNEI